MYTVFNLATMKSHQYQESVPRKQALKTTYALENNLETQLATSFGQLMNDLEDLIVNAGSFWTIDDFTVKKEIFAD